MGRMGERREKADQGRYVCGGGGDKERERERERGGGGGWRSERLLREKLRDTQPHRQTVGQTGRLTDRQRKHNVGDGEVTFDRLSQKIRFWGKRTQGKRWGDRRANSSMDFKACTLACLELDQLRLTWSKINDQNKYSARPKRRPFAYLTTFTAAKKWAGISGLSCFGRPACLCKQRVPDFFWSWSLKLRHDLHVLK